MLLSTSTASGAGAMLSLVVPLAIFFLLMYFMIMRPQKKEQQRIKSMLAAMEVGDTVVTTSGFYGVLKPFDGVTPYRLEMQAKLKIGQCKDLYAYWGDRLAKALLAETDCILNLASKEYSICISKYLPASVRFITCVFGEEKSGKVIEKGTMCKMARGEMVRFMAQNQIQTPEQIRSFDRLNYRFDGVRSDESTYVFLRKGEKDACD